jgi:hypothetical protein
LHPRLKSYRDQCFRGALYAAAVAPWAAFAALRITSITNGVGKHWDVAAGDLMRGGAHTLRHEALQLGLYSAVTRGHDVRTGLRPPGNTVNLLCEQVRGGREVSCPDDFLLLLRQVACEALDAVGEHPHSPIRDFDVGENVGDGEFRLLALRYLVRVRGECGDVDQPGDPIISSRSRNDASAVRVPDKNCWAADAPSVRLTVATLPASVSEAVLRGNHLITFRLKRGDHLTKTRTVSLDPVAKTECLVWSA